jgi:toxin FitB
VIILDTNVVSAVMRDDPVATDWLTRVDDPRLSAVTISEIAYGLHRLPRGRRRASLEAAWRAVVDAWHDRTLPVTANTAEMAGVVMARREQMGRPVALADALIAATCLMHEADIATANGRDFEALGLSIIDPWQAQPSS